MDNLFTNSPVLNTAPLINKPQASLSNQGKKDDQAKIAETAESFEAFFVTKMMESMFENVSTDGMFGGGNAEKIYRSLLLDQYGQAMAKSGQIGVKDDIMRSILQMQEAASTGNMQG